MLKTHAVGIDLGTTYSCIAYLNEQGEPVTIANAEGELSTPSVVMFEHGQAIVGTEALRNAIVLPDNVVANAKRFLGDAGHKSRIEGKDYTPVDISALVLKKLLADAAHQIGPIERAVITVPAQFSDLQRQLTIEAGKRAGLKQVDIINEPVAAALCFVLGNLGLWFTELANEQRILVYDLGGGTFDLSLVKYHKNEVRVLASSGDLHLGGIDWNQVLINAVADKFQQEFKVDVRRDKESLQFLSWEVEQTKRSLSVRPKAPLTCQHGGHRKTYQIEQEKFNKLTKPLVERTREITKRLLKDHGLGWQHVDVILTTGGSSRMPMVREMLKELGGRTLNTSLSPDQSIAHGAAYYAGMLISNNEFAHSILTAAAAERLGKFKQQSVTARGLGIIARDEKGQERIAHYLIQPNTPLPASVTQTFGTVVPNQKRVHLHIIESGARPELPHVELGACVIESLPPKLPVDSQIAVTISYDAEARVHVSAKEVVSGKEAKTEIIRPENVTAAAPAATSPDQPLGPSDDVSAIKLQAPATRGTVEAVPPSAARAGSLPTLTTPQPPAPPPRKPALAPRAESTDFPVPVCSRCSGPLDASGVCQKCFEINAAPVAKKSSDKPADKPPAKPSVKPAGAPKLSVRPPPAPKNISNPKAGPSDSEIMELPRKK